MLPDNAHDPLRYPVQTRVLCIPRKPPKTLIERTQWRVKGRVLIEQEIKLLIELIERGPTTRSGRPRRFVLNHLVSIFEDAQTERFSKAIGNQLGPLRIAEFSEIFYRTKSRAKILVEVYVINIPLESDADQP